MSISQFIIAVRAGLCKVSDKKLASCDSFKNYAGDFPGVADLIDLVYVELVLLDKRLYDELIVVTDLVVLHWTDEETLP